MQISVSKIEWSVMVWLQIIIKVVGKETIILASLLTVHFSYYISIASRFLQVRDYFKDITTDLTSTRYIAQDNQKQYGYFSPFLFDIKRYKRLSALKEQKSKYFTLDNLKQYYFYMQFYKAALVLLYTIENNAAILILSTGCFNISNVC